MSVDRRYGVAEGLAVKAPARLATTEPIVHFGLQEIDGEQLVDNDRVLDKDHADATLRGIWIASSGAWRRAPDFDGARDVVHGTRVFVAEGDINAEREFYVTTANPIVIGTTGLAFGSFITTRSVRYDVPQALTAEERTIARANISAARMRDFDVRDFGAVGDGASHALSEGFSSLAAAQAEFPFVTSLSQEFDWAATQKAYNTAGERGGGGVGVPFGTYLINSRLIFNKNNVYVEGDGPGQRYYPGGAAATTLKWTGDLDEFVVMSGLFAAGENTVYGGIKGLYIDGNLRAAYGLAIKDNTAGFFDRLAISQCSFTQMLIGNTTNSGAQIVTSRMHFGDVLLDARNMEPTTAHGLILQGESDGGPEGVTKLLFENLEIFHANGHGILVEGAQGADNLTFIVLNIHRANEETGYGVYCSPPAETGISGYWDILHANVTGGFHIANAGVALGWFIHTANDNELNSGATLLSGAGAGDVWARGALNNTLYGRARIFDGAAVKVSGTQVVAGRKTGWALPTGTSSRATFATSTVTTEQLAQRLKALIEDLEATGGHGLIGS